MSLARRLTTWATERRRPRIVARPARTSGVCVTRSIAFATASSLTEFLLTRGDKRTLLEFGQYANESGWAAALRKYYQIASPAELQRSWQRWIQQSPT